MATTAHVTNDSSLIFLNKCQCIVDYDKLQAALQWFGWTPRKWVAIFINMEYPTVTYKKGGVKRNIAIHRLIGMYDNKRILPREIHVHHIDENKVNAMSSNLELKTMAEHKKYHHSIRPRMPKKEAVKMNYEKLLADCRERHKKIGSPIAVLQLFSASS